MVLLSARQLCIADGVVVTCLKHTLHDTNIHVNCIRSRVQLRPFAIPMVVWYIYIIMWQMTVATKNHTCFRFSGYLTWILQIFLLSVKSGSFLRKSSQWRLAIEVLSEAKLSGGESVNFHWRKTTTSSPLTTKQWFCKWNPHIWLCEFGLVEYQQKAILFICTKRYKWNIIVLENTPLVYPIALYMTEMTQGWTLTR